MKRNKAVRLIDADVLKNHYSWWNDENKRLFDEIIDLQPEVTDEAEIMKRLCAAEEECEEKLAHIDKGIEGAACKAYWEGFKQAILYLKGR